mmetsp:Transcript_29033/g.64417  ORF Transcript_29033/g.64417 Transcript_29033/m.64417 type:complete len:202 (+) Transcript_29033:104-709(+)
MAKRKASVPSMEERADPKLRGVHRDGIQADVSPSSRAECIDCGKPIAKGSARWGIKYGGNPLTGIGAGVIPLNGTHPMVMWCHAGGCGLKYQPTCTGDSSSRNSTCEAARTCHLCSDSPDDDDESSSTPQIKLLCGGNAKGKKIRRHAFHIQCWKGAINRASTLGDEDKTSIIIDPSDIDGWANLSESEQNYVRRCWNYQG